MSSATERTSAGTVDVVFGVNGWVMVGVERGDRVQRQVASVGELATMLRELHLLDEEANTVAARLWRRRPRDFALPSPHGDESPRHATGLPGWVQVALLLAIVALALYGLYEIASGLGSS